MPSRPYLSVLLTVCFASSVAAAQEQPKSPADLFERVNPSVCTVIGLDGDGNPGSLGSGFVLSEGQRLVTNAHVVEGYDNAEVKCGNEYTSIVRILKYRKGVDLVVAEIAPVRVDGLHLSNATNIKPGTQVFAFGSPFGLEGTISPGLASAQREIRGELYLQISAPISSGSSGGPVTDETGLVVAVTVASLDSGQNLNFAIPAWILRDLPAVNLTLAQLTAITTPRPVASRSQPSVSPDFDKPTIGQPIDESGQFRGYKFGTSCSRIIPRNLYIRIQQDRRRYELNRGNTLGGAITKMFGEYVDLKYQCDWKLGLLGGEFLFKMSQSAVIDEAFNTLTSKYGSAQSETITAEDAKAYGCFTRRQSKPTLLVWQVSERYRIEFINCVPGYKPTSKNIYKEHRYRAVVRYYDPVLNETSLKQAAEDSLSRSLNEF